MAFIIPYYKDGLEKTRTSDLTAYQACALTQLSYKPLCFAQNVYYNIFGEKSRVFRGFLHLFYFSDNRLSVH